MEISKNEFKCVNCGAILNKGIILCPYCKTSYPLKKKKAEAERPQERPVERPVELLPEHPVKRPVEHPVERPKKVPYRIGKIGDVESSTSRNTIFLGILIARIITGFLVFSDIQLQYFRAVFSCAFLILVPGLLIMLMLKIRKTNIWEYLIYTIGLSLAFLMFGGLFVNLVFPVLSILGATTLNNGGSNYLTMIMIGGIVVYFFFLILFRKKLNHNVYPWGILMTSISLLLSYSLRSWHLTGGDISLEYYVFQLTKSLSHWSSFQFNDPYNTCLSITVLPTVLSNFLNISDEYIYKVIFPIIFSFSVVGLYF